MAPATLHRAPLCTAATDHLPHCTCCNHWSATIACEGLSTSVQIDAIVTWRLRHNKQDLTGFNLISLFDCFIETDLYFVEQRVMSSETFFVRLDHVMEFVTFSCQRAHACVLTRICNASLVLRIWKRNWNRSWSYRYRIETWAYKEECRDDVGSIFRSEEYIAIHQLRESFLARSNS